MKQFTSVQDVDQLEALMDLAFQLKRDPLQFQSLGKGKTLGLIFLNPSLRTRLSTQKAGMNLGLQVMVMNLNQEGWAWELEEGAVMNGSTVEHIKDAAAVISQYCDVVGIRCFPSLSRKEEDDTEHLLHQFLRYCQVPVISLESATLHPLQSFADLMTIREHWPHARPPKVVLSWAPHIKPLPQAVANSFSQWMNRAEVDFTITHPEGYELDTRFSGNARITHHQDEALEGADFIYVKNWSSYENYGQLLPGDYRSWLLTEQKLQASPSAKIMHCLPVRRNVELRDELLDNSRSLILKQAENRLYAAQAVLKRIIEN